MKIAIVGAGPSGLMAAWASTVCGHSVTLFDKTKQLGKNHGVFYLHESCGLPILPHARLITKVVGVTAQVSPSEAYSLKVYGEIGEDVSLNRLTGGGTGYFNKLSTIWNAQIGMELLSSLFAENIEEKEIKGPNGIEELLGQFEKVIITAPAFLFLDVDLRNEFKSTVAHIKHVETNFPLDKAIMVYSVGEDPVYRWSITFGQLAIERTTSAPGFFEVKKVKGTSVDLKSYDSNILWAGRYGSWNKNILTHNVYEQVIKWLS
jgi:hypothetical protein